jgi:hypothetical protein
MTHNSFPQIEHDGDIAVSALEAIRSVLRHGYRLAVIWVISAVIGYCALAFGSGRITGQSPPPSYEGSAEHLDTPQSQPSVGYKQDEHGQYLDAQGQPTQDPNEYVVVLTGTVDHTSTNGVPNTHVNVPWATLGFRGQAIAGAKDHARIWGTAHNVPDQLPPGTDIRWAAHFGIRHKAKAEALGDTDVDSPVDSLYLAMGKTISDFTLSVHKTASSGPESNPAPIHGGQLEVIARKDPDDDGVDEKNELRPVADPSNSSKPLSISLPNGSYRVKLHYQIDAAGFLKAYRHEVTVGCSAEVTIEGPEGGGPPFFGFFDYADPDNPVAFDRHNSSEVAKWDVK